MDLNVCSGVPASVHDCIDSNKVEPASPGLSRLPSVEDAGAQAERDNCDDKAVAVHSSLKRQKPLDEPSSFLQEGSRKQPKQTAPKPQELRKLECLIMSPTRKYDSGKHSTSPTSQTGKQRIGRSPRGALFEGKHNVTQHSNNSPEALHEQSIGQPPLKNGSQGLGIGSGSGCAPESAAVLADSDALPAAI